MTLIYLDTANLVKLARKYGSVEQQFFISEKLKNSNKQLIYSIAHLMEISNHNDPNHLKEIGDFMENLPHQWILFSAERIQNEIEYAWNIFSRKFAIPRSIFKERPTDLLPPSVDSLEIALVLGNKKLSDILLVFYNDPDMKKLNQKIMVEFSPWTKRQRDIAHEPGWEKKLKITLRKRLRQKIEASIDTFTTDNAILEKFLDYLILNPKHIKSFLPEFYVLHMVIKNRSDNFASNAISEIVDLEHFSAAAYAEVFSCDKRMTHDIAQAQKKFKLEFGNLKILKTEKEVEDFLLA